MALRMAIIVAAVGYVAFAYAAPKTAEAGKAVGMSTNEHTSEQAPTCGVPDDSKLTPEQRRILRERGTERAFTGKYWNHHERGTYVCISCGQVLFRSDGKFDSGCGWPSFSGPAATNAVRSKIDRSHGMVRTEVLCAGCNGHLGHVFDDGPAPSGLRYCINSAVLDFKPATSNAQGQTRR